MVFKIPKINEKIIKIPSKQDANLIQRIKENIRHLNDQTTSFSFLNNIQEFSYFLASENTIPHAFYYFSSIINRIKTLYPSLVINSVHRGMLVQTFPDILTNTLLCIIRATEGKGNDRITLTKDEVKFRVGEIPGFEFIELQYCKMVLEALGVIWNFDDQGIVLKFTKIKFVKIRVLLLCDLKEKERLEGAFDDRYSVHYISSINQINNHHYDIFLVGERKISCKNIKPHLRILQPECLVVKLNKNLSRKKLLKLINI